MVSKTNSNVITARDVVNLYFFFLLESYDSKAKGKKIEANKVKSMRIIRKREFGAYDCVR